MYINAEESKVKRSFKELKQFAKVQLKPGESKELALQLSIHDFKYYSNETNNWELEPGVYKVLLGNSSRNIKLSSEITL